MAFAMSAMKAQTFGILFGNAWMDTRGAAFNTTNYLFLIIPDVPVNLFLLGSWGGFYFGVNYYLNLRNEMENAVISARLADQAQLKMLRYQLNPHFLFNTLNAISTLVLEKDSKHANAMLTQLSAFLRYSLDSDPLQKTSLAEEVRALKLYLEIEKTRFGDRLKVDFQIDEDLLDARVPSLILQPAIENAIKYAIAQMESGGVITIIGKRKGAWALSEDAPEATGAFLLNHLIHELMPPKGDGHRWNNSDPITGQAAWFDLRVRIEKVNAPSEAQPAFPPLNSPVEPGPQNLAWKVGK